MYGGNNGTPMPPLYVDENQLQYNSNASAPQLQLFGAIPAGCSVDPTNYMGNNNVSSLTRSIKRAKETDDTMMQQKLQISLNNIYQDEIERSVSIPNPNAVSTGLKLSYDDDDHNSSVTTASGSMSSLPVISSMGEIRTEIESQKEEFDYFIRIQEEEFTKGMKELKQRHMVSFLNAIDKGVSQRIYKKQLEIDSINRRNKDLAYKIRQQAIEAQNWQYRARYNESVVHTLQTNLKQALAVQSSASNADQTREGCGDSEVDDAASSYYDPYPQNNQNMNCRVCGRMEVSMLILPCRHLCMCKDCDSLVADACPVCMATKTASVEVYMSSERKV